jgi:hypothetical protein
MDLFGGDLEYVSLFIDMFFLGFFYKLFASTTNYSLCIFMNNFYGEFL